MGDEDTSINSKRNVKRAIMTLVPGVPAPVVDYALNTPLFASVVGSGSASMRRGSASTSSVGDTNNSPLPRFTLKRMDSGNWGEYSLTSPTCSRRYSKDFFSEPNNLVFDLKPADDTPQKR